MNTGSPALAGRVAIVTGAGKGLGRAWAVHLASQGARVVVNNRNSTDGPGVNSADVVVEEIRRAGGEAIANYDSAEKAETGPSLVALALQEFGQLDIVIANAGVDRAVSFHKQALSEFEHVMEINFFAVVRLLHAAWPVLREQRFGRVLVSGSTAGCYGNHGQSAYSSSKAALLGLVKSLAIEGRSRNIMVNVVAPYAATQLTGPTFPEEQRSQFAPDAVSPLVSWLVSEACDVTGRAVIAGAGHARLAATLETGTVPLADDMQTVMTQLVDAPCAYSPDSAIAEFEAFRHSI